MGSEMTSRVHSRLETAYQALFELGWDIDGRMLTEYVAAVKPLRAFLDGLVEANDGAWVFVTEEG